MEFKKVDVNCDDAKILIEELNTILIGIIGNNGAKHVNLDDFYLDNSVFMIGYEGTIPMCCAGIRPFHSTAGEVKRVYARKNDKGYAYELMEKLEVWASEHGYKKLLLECREVNQHAINFYKRIGYKTCEKYTPYENQADAICMSKSLM